MTRPPKISPGTANNLQNTPSRFEPVARISSLAALLLNDKNHSKHFRIEAAVKIVLREGI